MFYCETPQSFVCRRYINPSYNNNNNNFKSHNLEYETDCGITNGQVSIRKNSIEVLLLDNLVKLRYHNV